jgi:exonuclease, DNA polymerase III, epsilon subunit family
MKLPQRLAFVDLETTGGTATHDRITEVGMVLVDEDGVREWSSLINPETRIPPFIESLTGISQAMVEHAPTFAELADTIHAELAGRLFIAHNARFDHGFLKNAFARTGHVFRPQVLCTVKLSRRLYPGFARHNLDSLIERHGLDVSSRHRALGDARLIWQFWQRAHAEFSPDAIQDAIDRLGARPTLPSHLDPALLDTLPEAAGVYRFWGENEVLLYVGKAKQIRSRVLAHFRGDHQQPRALAMLQQLRHIDHVATGGEIGALLLEAALIKEAQPAYNRRLRRNDEVCAWQLIERDGAATLKLVHADELLFGAESNFYGPFQHPRKASAALRELVAEHSLCPALTGLGKTAARARVFRQPVAALSRRVLRPRAADRAHAAARDRVAAVAYPAVAVPRRDCPA